MNQVDELSMPGFGWATGLLAHNNKSVVVKDGICLDNVDEGIFGNFSVDYLIDFLQFQIQANHKSQSLTSATSATAILQLQYCGFSIEQLRMHFIQSLRNALTSYFNGALSAQLDEIVTTKRSNGRQMYWNLMIIKANASFRLHAHPNIEVIFVVNGAMHEHRYLGQPPKTVYSATDVDPPDMSSYSSGAPSQSRFIHRCVSAPRLSSDGATYSPLEESFLINDKGSVHLSFTREEGAVLLVLWSAAHVNIPTEFQPLDLLLPIPEGVFPA